MDLGRSLVLSATGLAWILYSPLLLTHIDPHSVTWPHGHIRFQRSLGATVLVLGGRVSSQTLGLLCNASDR